MDYEDHDYDEDENLDDYNRGAWGNNDPYYMDEQYADDFFDWQEAEGDEDDTIMTFDEYLGELPAWRRPIERLKHWWECFKGRHGLYRCFYCKGWTFRGDHDQCWKQIPF